MRHKTTILFDFDGTLADSQEGIINAILYALEQLGHKEENREKLTAFIGGPLSDSFKIHYGFDEETSGQAILHLRDYYSEKGVLESVFYEGIRELLQELQELDKQLIVATAKPTHYANQILENHNLHTYFSIVEGSGMKGDILHKQDVIANVLSHMPDADRSEMVMIGDSKFDLIGANHHGMDSIAVTYGYGELWDLEAHSPNETVHSVQELRELLLN